MHSRIRVHNPIIGPSGSSWQKLWQHGQVRVDNEIHHLLMFVLIRFLALPGCPRGDVGALTLPPPELDAGSPAAGKEDAGKDFHTPFHGVVRLRVAAGSARSQGVRAISRGHVI